MEESGYAGFIMPIEVYFKNKVGARSPREAQWATGPALPGGRAAGVGALQRECEWRPSLRVARPRPVVWLWLRVRQQAAGSVRWAAPLSPVFGGLAQGGAGSCYR